MAPSLNDPQHLQTYDPGNMLQTITRFTQNARKAIKEAEKLDLTRLQKTKHSALLVAGMGGSAVGGLLLRDWLTDTSRTPIHVQRGYHLPAWADQNTLVYCVSYSGNTEETLRQYHEAQERGCPTVCFTSGGKLGQSAGLRKTPLLKYPQGLQPRAAIAHQFFATATVTRRLGIIDDETWTQTEEALKVLDALSREMQPATPTAFNPAKRLAENLKGYIPFVYGGPIHETVAYRYTTQFNENSKSPAAYSYTPEAFHNSVMASEAPKELLSRCCAVIIRDPKDEELKPKTDRFIELLSRSFGKVIEVEASGQGKLARILSALYIGDYASAYLAILYGRDPSSTDSITSLKQV
ncbi:bifunctional phosphoglucose/phosphomannose isomerase [Candidatus Bathyarchaeota archaeon]|nr:bifunctional phosphoglucose/phosphomannose isomerase [Candidatus Bathyarchaeota archaeon]